MPVLYGDPNYIFQPSPAKTTGITESHWSNWEAFSLFEAWRELRGRWHPPKRVASASQEPFWDNVWLTWAISVLSILARIIRAGRMGLIRNLREWNLSGSTEQQVDNRIYWEAEHRMKGQWVNRVREFQQADNFTPQGKAGRLKSRSVAERPAMLWCRVHCKRWWYTRGLQGHVYAGTRLRLWKWHQYCRL